MKLVASSFLKQLIEPIFNRYRKVELQLLLERAVRDIGQLLLQAIILKDPPSPFLYDL